MINRLCMLVLIGALATACGKPPVASERPQVVAAPASSWVPPETCLPQESVSLAGLERKTNSELRKLATHYQSCEDDQDWAQAGRIAALEALASRGDGSAAADLANIFKYQANPNRTRSLRWAEEAIRLGEQRGQAIKEEWGIDDRRSAAR